MLFAPLIKGAFCCSQIASATKVFISYGTTQYSTDMGGSSELSVSGDISSYVKSLFDSVGYTSVFDFWGTRDQQTQPNTVYNYAEWATRFRDTTVILYKGHSLPVTCPISCGNDHYGVYDCEGYDVPGGETIEDYQIYNKIYDEGYGAHDFVFLWTCGAGDPSRLGSTSGSHGWGMCASWMGINNAATSLSDDGYDDPDGTIAVSLVLLPANLVHKFNTVFKLELWSLIHMPICIPQQY